MPTTVFLLSAALCGALMLTGFLLNWHQTGRPLEYSWRYQRPAFELYWAGPLVFLAGLVAIKFFL